MYISYKVMNETKYEIGNESGAAKQRNVGNNTKHAT